MEVTQQVEQQAIRHIRLRWIGAPFLLGLIWLFIALQQALAGGLFSQLCWVLLLL